MKNKYNILLVCAMGYSTSSIIKLKLQRIFEENDINAELQNTSVNKVSNFTNNIDLIITSLDLDSKEYNVPVINAVDLISGRNYETISNKILETLKSIE